MESSIVYKKVLSKPEKWRLISDRDAGSIIAFERIKEGSKFDSKKLLRSRLKWKWRNLKWYDEEFTKGRKKEIPSLSHLWPPKVTDEYSTDPLLYFERDANNNLLNSR